MVTVVPFVNAGMLARSAMRVDPINVSVNGEVDDDDEFVVVGRTWLSQMVYNAGNMIQEW